MRKMRDSRKNLGKKKGIKSALLTRSNKKFDDSDKENVYGRGNNVQRGGLLEKLIEGHENAVSSANKMKRSLGSSGKRGWRYQQLEEEITMEKSKNAILENDLMILEEKLEAGKAKYTQTLKTFHEKIAKFKNLQNLILEEKTKSEKLFLENKSMQVEMRKYLEFIISILSNISLLPETIEVEANSKTLLEFSFEKKTKANIPKALFIQNKLITFIQSNSYRIETLDLVDSINKIMSDYNEKMSQVEKQSLSRQESLVLEEFKNLNASFISNASDSKLFNNSSFFDSVSPQNNQNNSNYNININLVMSDTLNDSSGTKPKSQKKGKEMAKKGSSFDKIVNFFHQELGLNSSVTNDSSILGGYEPYEDKDSFSFDKSGGSVRFINTGLEAKEGKIKAKGGEEGADKIAEGKNEAESGEGVGFAIALGDFLGENSADLSFSRGDRIRILRKSDTGWWVGRILGQKKTGYLPATFVKEI